MATQEHKFTAPSVPAAPGLAIVEKREDPAVLNEEHAQEVPAQEQPPAQAPPPLPATAVDDSPRAAVPDQSRSGMQSSLQDPAAQQPTAVVAVQQTDAVGRQQQPTGTGLAGPAPLEVADVDFAAVQPSLQPTDVQPMPLPGALQPAQTTQAGGLAAAPAGGAHGTVGPRPPDDYEQPTAPEERHPMKPTWRRGYSGDAYHVTRYLLCTLTPSDCSTKRLRPPREPRLPPLPGRLPARLRCAAVLPCAAHSCGPLRPAAGTAWRSCHLMLPLNPSTLLALPLPPPRAAGEWYDSLLGVNQASFVVGTQTPDGTPASFLLKAHAYECEGPRRPAMTDPRLSGPLPCLPSAGAGCTVPACIQPLRFLTCPCFPSVPVAPLAPCIPPHTVS
jgi:hypothetical protein